MSDQATTETQPLPLLSLEQIAQADDRPEQRVDVPEWGGAVMMRPLSEQQLTDLRDKATVGGVLNEARAARMMLLAGITQPALGPEHEGLLAGKNASVVARLLGALVELNGLGEGFQKAAEAGFREGRA